MVKLNRNKFFYMDIFLSFGVWATLLRNDLSLLHICIFSSTIIMANTLAGTYKTPWQYFSFNDLENNAFSFIFSFSLGSAYNFFYKSGPIGIKYFLSSYILAHTSLLFARFLWRWTYSKIYQFKKINDEGRKIICYGSGQEALSLMDFVLKGPYRRYDIVGYIDDNKENVGKVIQNKKVLGVPEQIGNLVAKYKVTDIIVSNYHIDVTKLKFILEKSYQLGVKVTRMEENILPNDRSGIGSVVRELNLEDLLDRKKAQVDLSDFQAEVSNKIILVTGAGGSIGSEIAKQITSHNAGSLFLIDNHEYNLFKVLSEIKEQFPSQYNRVTPLLMDLSNQSELDKVIDEIKPNFIYHAAAYKHVHLLELNPFNGIINNVRGTYNLLKAAARNKVTTFLLVSTDKAVAPRSIMGATKRICELMVASYANESKNLYCSVRFGNVLGSSGSLIPILEEKIQNNQSLTITDERMKRYFMLIPEAVSLVLKTSMIADTGDICVLKMGKPIAIVDIARKLLLLRGKSEKEIPIIFTGAKKGEKLVEDLYLKGDELDTTHQDIVVLPESRNKDFKKHVSEVSFNIRRMIELAEKRNHGAIDLLWEIVKKDGDEVLGEEEVDVKKAL